MNTQQITYNQIDVKSGSVVLMFGPSPTKPKRMSDKLHARRSASSAQHYLNKRDTDE